MRFKKKEKDFKLTAWNYYFFLERDFTFSGGKNISLAQEAQTKTSKFPYREIR